MLTRNRSGDGLTCALASGFHPLSTAVVITQVRSIQGEEAYPPRLAAYGE
jgi:hypothetical protein